MKKEDKKNEFYQLSKSKIKKITGGNSPKRLEIVVDGQIFVFWV
jgi:hypothetical protein